MSEPVVVAGGGGGVSAWRRIVCVAAIVFDAIFLLVLLIALLGAFLEQSEAVQPKARSETLAPMSAHMGPTPPRMLIGVIIVMIGGFALNIVAITVGGLPGSARRGAGAIADEFT